MKKSVYVFLFIFSFSILSYAQNSPSNYLISGESKCAAQDIGESAAAASLMLFDQKNYSFLGIKLGFGMSEAKVNETISAPARDISAGFSSQLGFRAAYFGLNGYIGIILDAEYIAILFKDVNRIAFDYLNINVIVAARLFHIFFFGLGFNVAFMINSRGNSSPDNHLWSKENLKRTLVGLVLTTGFVFNVKQTKCFVGIELKRTFSLAKDTTVIAGENFAVTYTLNFGFDF
jgi:hypothetical protein